MAHASICKTLQIEIKIFLFLKNAKTKNKGAKESLSFFKKKGEKFWVYKDLKVAQCRKT